MPFKRKIHRSRKGRFTRPLQFGKIIEFKHGEVQGALSEGECV
jgi:hypothetical protein